MAQEAASFRIEMEATSLGFISFRLISIPSTRTRGDELFSVPVPLIRTEDVSAFGWLPVFITLIPAAIPESDAAIVVTGRCIFLSLKLMLATDPVRLTFFCSLYPTTTTSSKRLVSSFSTTGSFESLSA